MNSAVCLLLLKKRSLFIIYLQALTASGDGSAHIWKAAVIPDRLAHAIGGVSSEESADSESEDTGVFTTSAFL